MHPSFSPPPGINKRPLKGWLFKKGSVIKTWHRRWFVLKDVMLCQFSREDDIKSQASYLLTDRSFRVIENSINTDEPDKFCFSLVPDQKLAMGTGETVMLAAVSTEERHTWVRALRHVLYSNVGGAIFGQSLEETMIHTRKLGRRIPVIIEQCVEHLIEHGLEMEGIFRLPGRAALVRELKEKYDCAEQVSFEVIEPDVSSVASLLKSYLRELPESIIPCKLYQRYMNFALRYIDAANDETRAECVLELSQAMSDLPKDNYTILKYLCKFLHDVASKSDVNKMTVNNLATVFGPNIIRHLDDNPELFKLTAEIAQRLTFMMIDSFDKVFAFDYRDDGNLAVPEADLLKMSCVDFNPVLTPRSRPEPRGAASALDDLSSLQLNFSEEVFDQLSQCSSQSPLSPLSPDSPLVFSEKHFHSSASESDSKSVEAESVAGSQPDLRQNSGTKGPKPIPPKRKSRLMRGRRVSDRRPESENVTVKDEPTTVPDSVAADDKKDQQYSQADTPQTNGTPFSISNDTSALNQEADGKVGLSTMQIQLQNDALKQELVNVRTQYESKIKCLQTEKILLKDGYEKRIQEMENMIMSQNECLQKEKKDRAEAVERVVHLQAELHKYQMLYGELPLP